MFLSELILIIYDFKELIHFKFMGMEVFFWFLLQYSLVNIIMLVGYIVIIPLLFLMLIFWGFLLVSKARDL